MSEFQQWTCDVLVVGAGPAGSTAARFAAGKGVSVILLERREQVGLPVRCAEYVPLPVSRYVDLNRPGILVQPVRAMQTFIPGDSVKETAVPGAMICRDRWIRNWPIWPSRPGPIKDRFPGLEHDTAIGYCSGKKDWLRFQAESSSGPMALPPGGPMDGKRAQGLFDRRPDTGFP